MVRWLRTNTSMQSIQIQVGWGGGGLNQGGASSLIISGLKPHFLIRTHSSFLDIFEFSIKIIGITELRGLRQLLYFI